MWTFDFSIMTFVNILLFILIILMIFLVLFIIVQFKKISQKQNQDNVHFNEILQKQNEENLQRDKQIKELKQQINNFAISNYLEKALNKNLKIYSEKKMAVLEEQYQKIMNSYKIVYFRKMSNLILDNLFKSHKKMFSKTRPIFCNDEKPDYRKNTFPIIIVDKKFDNILKVDKYLINLIIDYLMYMKDFTSAIIHLSDIRYNVQIEILSQYIGHEVEMINDKYYLSSEELINLTFQQEKTDKTDNKSIINKNLNINNINNLDIKNDNNNEINNNKEEISTENSENLMSLNGFSPKSQNGKSSVLGKISQKNKEENVSNNNNNERSINKNLNDLLDKAGDEIKDIPSIDNKDKNFSGTSKIGKIKKKIIKKKGIKRNNEEIDDEIIEEDEENVKNEDNKENKEGEKQEGNKKNKTEKKKKNKTAKKKAEKDEDKKEEDKKEGGKKEDKKEKEKPKKAEEVTENSEKAPKEVILNNNINKKDLSQNEADDDTLSDFDELIDKLKNNDEIQNPNTNVLNNENKNNETKRVYSYDIKEMKIVLFNENFQFKNDKVEILKEIKEYIIKISKIKSEKMDAIIKIDSNYIFNSWRNTFGKGYKNNKLYTKLVQIDRYPDLNIDKFREALLLLIPDKKFEILSEDPSKFDKMIDNELNLGESENY